MHPAIAPAGVLELSGGIVEVVGFAPDRPDQEVRVRLVGARLAPPDPDGGEPKSSRQPIRAGYTVE